ncbi:MAG TPA: FhaA domain-containing protein [Mycobacterium sp.]|nr:FhaA domain-containing protein [Mycobacterium sp.]HTX97941.1 FhaA domain-containing protein [Mycobacterium sp.]
MSSQRGLVARIERKLEMTVDNAFARVFGGSIVPEEVEALLRREARDGIRKLEGNRLLVPNEYIITLGRHDFEKVGADPDLTSSAFARDLADYFDEQGWQTYGDVVIRFEQSSNLRTGQYRARGAVNPDVQPRPTVNDPVRRQSSNAFGAERGVAPMTDNSSYRGAQGPERPGDEYYDDRHGRPQDDPRGGPEPQGGPDPRAGYPPEQGGYPPPQGYPPPRHPDQAGYPDQGGYQEQRGYPEQGGYPDQRGGYQEQGGYPEQRGYPEQGGYPDQRGGYQEQRGHPDQGQGGYPPSYEQRPPAAPSGYGPQGYDQGYRPGGGYAPPPPGGQPGGAPQGYGGGYGEYGRGPGRQDEAGYAPPEQRPAYPEQGGYEQGYQQGGGYGRQDYGRGDYTQYGENVPAGPYPGQGGGYPDTAHRDYDYGQPGEYAPPSEYAAPADYGQPAEYGQPAGGYGGYGAGGYGAAGTTVTLQLDDGSGRTYQLREGANVVGRGQDAQFRLPDTGVSRRHLEIRWDGQVALLTDLNSTNGTTVNNAPVQEWQLADGDVIRLGHSEIIVRIH